MRDTNPRTTDPDLPSDTDSLTLGLMTKYWVTGEVKTRLGVDIGMERAAMLHKRLVSHLCDTLADAADRRVVCLSPDRLVDRFNRDLADWNLQTRWQVIPQGTGDLGERMQRWFQIHLGEGETGGQRRAILIGADCPTIVPGDIAAAGNLLREEDVVLGPAADGGYYLIGLRGPWHRSRSLGHLFREIPWSGRNVLRVTRERLGSAGLSYGELDVREDIDTVNELQRLCMALQAPDHPLASLGPDISRILGDRLPSGRCTR